MGKEDFVGRIVGEKPYGLRVVDLLQIGTHQINGLSENSKLIYISDGYSSFQLADADNEHYRVGCTLSKYGGMRSLANTVLMFDNQRLRHPDLFAGKLLTFFVEQMRLHDPTMPLLIFSEWHKPMPAYIKSSSKFQIIEDNYEEYRAALRKGMPPREAALSTWSGRLFSSLGFTVNEDSDVEEGYNIYVTFSKS